MAVHACVPPTFSRTDKTIVPVLCCYAPDAKWDLPACQTLEPGIFQPVMEVLL